MLQADLRKHFRFAFTISNLAKCLFYDFALKIRAFTGKSARPLVPNKHNQNVRYNSGTVSYVQSTEWYLPKDMNQLESMFNKAKQSLKQNFLVQWQSAVSLTKKTVFSLWPCLHGGTICLRNRMSSEKSSRSSFFFVHVCDMHRDRFVLSAWLKFTFCALVKLYEWLPSVNST